MRRVLNAAAVVLGVALLLAALTAIGTAWIERRYPPVGRFLALEGGLLHVLERGADSAPGRPPVVLLHGASSNLQDMRLALGDTLAARGRVIMIDRPGHGWSDRIAGDAAASPAVQAAIVVQALDALGVERVVLVVHSWAGALGAAFALNHPQRLAGLVMLAPVTHPWPGGVAWYYTASTTRLLSELFVRTLAMPLGAPLLAPATAAAFAPQAPPENYAGRAAIALVLRPSHFLANARDVAALKAHVIAQAPRYGEIRVPTVVVHGAVDSIVSPRIHAAAFARDVPGAKLILLPGTGHMPHYAAPDLVRDEIERLARAATPGG